MARHWLEKLFRMKTGYMELTGDEFRTSPVSIKEYCTKCGVQRVRILD